jgi:hypothetical protein
MSFPFLSSSIGSVSLEARAKQDYKREEGRTRRFDCQVTKGMNIMEKDRKVA